MPLQYSNEPMLDMFIFETTQFIEQLEQSILAGEKSSCFTHSAINEIFRIMHTIKGSSAMMRFESISLLAHSMEDLFYFIREGNLPDIDCSGLSDLVLECIDFIKAEMQKIRNGDKTGGNPAILIKKIKDYLYVLKRAADHSDSGAAEEQAGAEKRQSFTDSVSDKAAIPLNTYKATIFFEEGCEMENIRAFTVIHKLKELAQEVSFIPKDIVVDNDESTGIIRREGFKVLIKSDCSYEKLNDLLMQTIFLKDLELTQLDLGNEAELAHPSEAGQDAPAQHAKAPLPDKADKQAKERPNGNFQSSQAQQSIISVSVVKLDRLMDLVGEMVISEAMVIQNPDLSGLELNNFRKAARQLHKITGELQDMVMSIRMVPLATTFHKMQRVVRDMSRKLGKEVHLELLGEDTEVDKNIIEHISDPLMHIIRNSIDHGIEPSAERQPKGKPIAGVITLEAKNAGSDVLVTVKDDGKGLDRNRILQKAKESGILHKPETEMSVREIYNLIFLPGFSTQENVSEFSGRGVGLDVVVKNIGAVGGSVSVDSTEGAGTTVTMKMPLTLAIIDGMNIKVGSSCYTIPTISIKESFRAKEKDIIIDPDGNEMVMVRGRCYPILRLHEHYNIRTHVTDLLKGILIMVEAEDEFLCLFADGLTGQQQVVVKALPEYIRGSRKIKGLMGCTLLGDGSISLILDIAGLVLLK